MLAYNAACNFISGVAWKEHTFNKVRLQRLVYYEVRARFHLPAQLAIRAIAKVADAYRVHKAKPCEFRPMGAVTYDSRVLRLLNLSQVSLRSLSGRIQVPLAIGGYQRNRLSAAVLGETDLVFDPARNRFSFLFTIRSEPPPVSRPAGFLGVDMGLKNVAADSDGHLYTGTPVRKVRQRSLRLRRRLQKLGTRGARRLLGKRRKKERRFQSHVNHTISKELVATAKGTGRGVAVEELTGIRDRITVSRKERAIHGAWAFSQLRFFLTYKCADAGIACVAVDPRNTSRTCPKCGCVDRRNRKSQSEFCCIECRCEGHADTFAAIEISRRASVGTPSCPERQAA
jgi:IS605 OrfB family transposase